MRRLIAILALLPLLGAGQVNMGPGRHRTAVVTSSCPFTDSFSGSGALSANWTAEFGTGTIVQNSGVAQNSSTYVYAFANVTGGGCSFPLDQYSQAYLGPNTPVASHFGLTVLVTSGVGYVTVCAPGSTTCNVYKGTLVSTGATTYIGTCTITTPAAGYGYKLAVTGSGGTQALHMYQDTGGGFGSSLCSITDSTYTSGSPGLYIYSTSPVTGLQWKTFQAD